jgi:hypothetical protein
MKDDPKMWEQANNMRRKEKLSALR